MNEKLLDLSGKIDPEIVEVISAVSAIASSLSIPFFLVGALARDFLFKHHNIPLRRSTLDVDLAVQVSSWAQHQKLIDDLIRHRQFLRTEKVYRLKLEETLVDIIPFGEFIVHQNSMTLLKPQCTRLASLYTGLKIEIKTNLGLLR